ncbi:MAG: metal ABC transporter permease [bacterium]
MFESPFFLRALIGSSIMGPVLGLLSSFIVLRNFAFAGLGITHALIGGIGFGFLIGMEPTYSIILSSIIIGTIMALVSLNQRINETTAIGIIFPFMMAVGIISIALSKRYSSDLLSYLFGNILLLTKTDLYITFILAAAILIWLFSFLKELIFISFNSELASASGINVSLYHFLFVIVVSVAIAISSKLMGLVLVSALTVIPGASATIIAKNFSSLLILSAILGFVSTVGGLFLSFALNIPTGATIIALTGAIFFIIFAAKGRK